MKAYENNMETTIWFHEIFNDLFSHANYELRAMIKNNEILFLSENQKRLINNFVFMNTKVGEYKNHKGQVWTKNSEEIGHTILVLN